MKRRWFSIMILALVLTQFSTAEVMLQYFNMSWNDIIDKLPELSEAGYNSLWLPPPTKASGGLSVGYDLWDPFDLGSKDQRSTVKTRYGTEDDLLRLIEAAHRFGMRVYFDNIMNHRAFDVPGYNESTPIDTYPGLLPEDFHLRVTEDGFYRKWNNVSDWNDTWQIQNRNFSDLIDIAQEPGTENKNFGSSEGYTHLKYSFVRDPDHPEYYCFTPDGTYVGFYSTNITKELLSNNASYYSEYVQDYLFRAVRWLVDRTKVDGLRLDAVKHVQADFFGATYGADKDESDYGYTGQAQRQFNITRGFSDANHRDTVFDQYTDRHHGRDDLMMFGEHLGEPPLWQDYIDAGMRLVDAKLYDWMNNNVGWGYIGNLQYSGGEGFEADTSVPFVKSHDNDYTANVPLEFACILTRRGLPNVYSDGNYQSETLGDSGGAFPRHANINYLGQYGDSRVPNLAYINNQFARGSQEHRDGDSDVAAYDRIDKSDNWSMDDTDGVAMCFMMNDNTIDGQYREIGTSFPEGAYLWQYASQQGNFYHTVTDGKIKVTIPPGGYFVFSWRSPEESDVWSSGTSKHPVMLYENGQECGWMSYWRYDGPDGDPNFNPYGVATEDTTAYGYKWYLPRVTSSSNLDFIVRTDGSAENILLRLDGGIDINSQMGLGPLTGDLRDNAPAVSSETYVGFEQPLFRMRIREKFAAEDISRNIIGSTGAETYDLTCGSAGFTVNQGSGTDSDTDTPDWMYHGPSDTNDLGILLFNPAPATAVNSNMDVWVKIAYSGAERSAFIYYTTDGIHYPEGSGGQPLNENTLVAQMNWSHNDASEPTIDWWKGTLPAQTNATIIRYKIGAYNIIASSVFPSDSDAVYWKKRMMTEFAITNFDAGNAPYYPHNDYGSVSTGLVEGFHVLHARPFLNHKTYDNNPATAIYNTFVQPFYYDTKTCEGDLLYPSQSDSLGDNEYGCLLRTDAGTKKVYFHIDDSDPTNDDGATGLNLGNGTNAAGQDAWADASETTPSLSITNTALPREWRFNYSNIPSNGTATITVKMGELSSSTNPLESASSGHFGEIIRTVNTDGPGYRMYIAWPQNNGDTVGEGYGMKVYFSNNLWAGGDQEEVIERFLITIDGEAQGRDQYQTSWYSEQLAFTLPDMYDGIPGNIHEIVVTHTNAAGLGVNLSATREVYAYPTAQGAHIDIVQPPEYDSDGKAYQVVLPDVATPTAEQRSFTLDVETDTDAQHVWLDFTQGDADSYLNTITTNANRLSWKFIWTNITEGSYRFYAYVNTNDASTNTTSAQAVRNTSVIFREICTTNSSLDWDDDGLFNNSEQASTNLPAGNPEAWLNGEVHIWYAYGHTDPLLPDTDGDKLPDALEYGWTAADSSQTDTNADTNGDGYPNFLADYDPPFYNTVPDNNGVPDYNLNDSRTKQIQGSVTDPGNPDTDSDGIPDGIEDWNRNGWVDGDGLALPPGSNWWDIRGSDEGKWPNDIVNAWETWSETSPRVADTDSDGASDGYGEDWDKNGWIAGDINSNRVWDAGELWTETDPLNADTDGDGLPDGWEFSYNLSPWDCGILGYTNMKTGLVITNTLNGASGNPDGDIVVNVGVTNEYTNLMEYQNGTNPQIFDSQEPPPEGSIQIGRGPALGSLTGISTQYVEFTDWAAEDCRAVDEYEGQGKNNQGGDIYKYWDEWDSSRDLIAFYEHDGGDSGQGGDDKYYFRVDLHDLKAHAEEGHLDIYIVIDTGNPAVGEMALPDEVDCTTSMKWEAVVGVYNSGNGILYVDTNRTHNTTEPYQDLADFGVVAKGPGDTHGFIDAYYNSELDAVEFSIRRVGLTDSAQGAGWTGLTDLNFQVYTVSDGTCNSCAEGSAGSGDIGGRPDIRDAIYNDYIAEDYDDSQASLPHVLMYWIPGDATINRAKFASVIHGNQAIQPGSVIQELLNDSQGGGYSRPLGSHELFATPLNLHITPTLASAIQWASIDPDDPDDWRKTKVADGPLFNQWIADLYATNIVYLFASSFSDHILPYFTDEFNADNIALAQDYLSLIYGFNPTTNSIFWTPERVLDSDTFGRIDRLGYHATCIDQMTHVWNWFGREAAIGSEGYRINRIEGIDCFVMNDGISEVRFENLDNGAALNLRNLLIRKALDDNTKDQVITMFSGWEDFSGDNANAYDRNLRWIANHQWILPLGLEQITADRTFNGDTWWSVDRGTELSLSKQAHNWLNHATKSNYDNWYVGADIYESLENKYFDIRDGVPLTNRFGMLYSYGLITQAWQQVSSVSNTNLTLLARSALHASVFETAFHDEDENNLSRWSTGDYIYPPTVYSELAAFSKNAQAQARIAAVYARVDQWANSASTITTTINIAEDIDLDGEDEYLLYNDRLFGLFERIGGRLIAVWVREIIDGSVYQASGNLIGYAGSDSEDEGTYNASTNTGELVIGSYRTSCLKDWWRDTSYVNDYYSPSSISNGWSFMSPDVRIIKQITLSEQSWKFNVEYVLFPLNDGVPLYVRNGFSPNLRDLLINGQSTLTRTNIAAGSVDLANTNYATTVSITVDYNTSSYNTLLNTDAVDDAPENGITFHTLNMRNQAQTQQIEVFGSNSFSFALGFRATPSDWNNNGMPNQWEDQYGLQTNALPGPDQDADGDGISNREEYIGNTDPTDANDFFHVSQMNQAISGTGITIHYPTVSDRDYYIDYFDGNLDTQDWINVDGPIQGTGSEQTWTDDGTKTPDPLQQDFRFYKIDVALPK